jgi:transcriptional regulatory protein RtcR
MLSVPLPTPHAVWERNFRDLNGAVTRMCTVAAGGRITVEIVEQEIERLSNLWSKGTKSGEDILLEEILGAEAARELDPFALGLA